MDFASSTRAAENRSRWKGIVANSSVVPRRPSKVVGQNRIDRYKAIRLLLQENLDILLALGSFIHN